MSISYSLTPVALRVEIKPSNYCYAALIGTALAALVAVFYAKLTWPLRFLFALGILAYSGYCIRTQRAQHGVLSWRSIWFWQQANGSERVLRLRHSTVWPGLIVLVFADIDSRAKWHQRGFVLTLCADSCDRDDARRLRVHLNHFPVFTAENVPIDRR